MRANLKAQIYENYWLIANGVITHPFYCSRDAQHKTCSILAQKPVFL